MLKEDGKFLIARFSSLGDILLTTPVIRSLRKAYPKSGIHFLCKEEYEDAVKYNRYLNGVHTFGTKRDFHNTIAYLKSMKFDYLIDLQNNFRSRGLKPIYRLQRFSYIKPQVKKFLLVNFKINLLKSYGRVPELYARGIPGLLLDNLTLDLFIPDSLTSRLPQAQNYIGFCPGSRHFTKRYPAEHFIQLGNKLTADGFKIVIFGGSDDTGLCEAISKRIDGSLNLCGGNQLLQMALDMKNCTLIVTNDSGLMHTATAVGVPVVALFGSSVREFGFEPCGVPNKILENNSLNCRPCSHIGRSKCPRKHFKCMLELSPEFVHENILNFISGL